MADHSFQLAVSAGSPRSSRTTSTPAVNNWAFDLSFKIGSYANWCDMLTMSLSNNNLMGFEFNSGGTLYFNHQQINNYTEHNIWTDGYTGWARIYGRFASSVQQVWVQRQGGSASLVVDITEALTFTPTAISSGANPNFLSDMNGTFRVDMLKIWSATKSQVFLETEVASRSVVDATNLFFYNSCDGSVAYNVDTGGAGNWTLTGSTTDQVDDSWPDPVGDVASLIVSQRARQLPHILL